MPKICSVEGCERPMYCRSMCTTHYQRFMTHGDPLYAPYQKTQCAVDGCERLTTPARKYCLMHKARMKRRGSTDVTQYRDGFRKAHKKESGILKAIIQRCLNPNCSAYKHYGGRGIGVCDRWRDKINGFKNFYEDMGACPQGCSLDRIDVNGDYSPENCRWADWHTQAFNKRYINKASKYRGVYKHRDKWCAHLDIKDKRYRSSHATEEKAYEARRAMERKYLGRELV